MLLAAFGVGCTAYKDDRSATATIWQVHLTTNPKDVAGCRLIESVDSRDTAKGCGLTVQPTPEECMRYQVRRAGGDTLLMNGPIGGAYACGAPETPVPTAGAQAPAAPPTTTTPTAVSTPAPPAPAAAVPAPMAPVPTPLVATPAPGPAISFSSDRATAKGCTYLGDVTGAGPCTVDHGRASGDCADQALAAGGDLILVDGARFQIFACKARP